MTASRGLPVRPARCRDPLSADARRRRGLGLCGLAVLGWAISAAFAAPAPAIPNTCPVTGPDSVAVTITEPAAASAVSGTVTVKGRASGPAGLFRIELFVGESLKDFQVVDPAANATEFTLRWDASGAGTLAEMVVVACGGRAGALVRGASSVTVRAGGGSTTTAAPPVRLISDPVSGDEQADRRRVRVGVVFGVGGLAGLVAATGLRRARRSPAGSGVPPV